MTHMPADPTRAEQAIAPELSPTPRPALPSKLRGVPVCVAAVAGSWLALCAACYALLGAWGSLFWFPMNLPLSALVTWAEPTEGWTGSAEAAAIAGVSTLNAALMGFGFGLPLGRWLDEKRA